MTLNILNVYYKYTNLCSQFTIALGKEGTKIKDFLLRDKVYKYLKNKISKHEYKPGSPIIEKEIENALSVSRTPIREAIRKLEQESLVEIFPRKGAFVSNISVKRIVEIYDIREIIEPNIIPIIINDINKKEIDKIKKELENIKEENPFNALKAEVVGRKVHNLIFSIFNNGVLNEIMDNFEYEKNRGCHLVHNDDDTALELLEHHLAVLKELEEGNAEKAKTILQKHLQISRNNILDRLNSRFAVKNIL